MKILYFAWVRERMGRGEETVEPPSSVATVADLLAWLKGRDAVSEAALASPQIRVAVNQAFAQPAHGVKPGDEIAIFPPVTGG
jgi:molybdopterin synthase sulfur carrier subunit